MIPVTTNPPVRRVLLVARTLPTDQQGGMEEHAWNLATALAKASAEVDLYTTSFTGRREVEINKGVRIVRLPHLPRHYQSRAWWRRWRRFASACRREFEQAGRPYDLILSEMLHARKIFRSARGRAAVKCYIVHGSTYQDYAFATRAEMLARRPAWHPRAVGQALFVRTKVQRERRLDLPKADWVIPVSRFVDEIFRKVYRVPDARLRTIGNAVRPPSAWPNRAEARQRLGLGGREPFVLFLGRLEVAKGPQKLLDLVKRRADWRLLLAGRGPLESEIRARLDVDPELGRRVRFLGFVDEPTKWDLYTASDVFALPSATEGEPIAILEALAAACPVATARPWVSPDIEHAVAVDADPEKAIARGLGLREEAAKAARLIRQERTWDSIARQYLDLARAA